MAKRVLQNAHMLPWGNDDRPILQRNTELILHWRSGGYHLVELDLHPQREDCPVILTVEGFERCPRCLVVIGQQDLDEHVFEKLECGREHEEAVEFCIMRCGRPFSAAADRPKTRTVHERTCDGTSPMLALDGKTLACPRCRFPGLTWEAFSRHISKCQGERRDVAKDIHILSLGITTTSIKHMPRCKCGFLISHRALSTHVCGLISDGAWLGTIKDVPDTSIPLLKWYQDHNLGFGGVPLPSPAMPSSSPPTHAGQPPLRTLPADGIKITDEVIARHYSSYNSLIGDARAFEDFPSKIADIQDLVRKFHQRSEAFLRYCKRRAESPEEEESSEIIDEEVLGGGFYSDDTDSGEDSEDDLDMDSAGIQHILDNFGDADSRLRSDLPHSRWFLRPRNYHAETKDLIKKFAAAVKGVALDERIELADDLTKGLRNLLNRATLQWSGITFDEPVLSRACPGFQWRHAQHPCPWSVADIDLSYADIICRFGSFCLIAPACSGCWAMTAKFAKWVSLSKYSNDGRPICCATGCQELREFGPVCKSHRDANLQAVARRLHSRDLQAQGRPTKTSYSTSYLQALLTPEDLQRILSNFVPRERGNQHDPWEQVAAEVNGECPHTNVFFVDTESSFLREGARIVFEVSFVDATGKNLLTTPINHGCTISELLTRIKVGPRRMTSYLLNIYKREGDNTPVQLSDPTHGMTPRELRDKMREIGIGHDSIIVEWSFSSWDRNAVTACVGSDFDSGTWIAAIRLPKILGWRGTRQLASLFCLCFPNDANRFIAHRASIDAIKALRVTRKLLSYMYKPSNG